MNASDNLAVYIHWPFCKAKCPYCDFNSHVREKVDQKDWEKAYLREIAHMASRAQDRRVTSIFFGGGTPSLMQPSLVAAMIEAVGKSWALDSNIEITLEANPTSAEAENFKAYKAAGVNRVSLGVQSLKAEDLKFLGRQHSPAEAMRAVEMAAGIFDRFTFDLIYALPNQTLGEWESQLRAALAYAGKHLSLYQLTIEPNTAFYHAYHEQKKFALPEDDNAAEMYALTQEIMEAHGLPAYEVSNHAAAGEASRHNLSYWRGEEYVGIGPGAHGRILVGGERRATAMQKSPERWLELTLNGEAAYETDVVLTHEECREEALMMGLRLIEGMSLARYDLAHHINQTALQKFVTAGLLHHNPPHLRATRNGMLVLNHMLGELLG